MSELKFSPRRIGSLVRKLAAEGKKPADIVVILNNLGEKTAKGREWTKERLAGFITRKTGPIFRAKKGSRRKRIVSRPAAIAHLAPKASTKTGDLISKGTILSVLTDPHLSDAQALRMIRAYLEVNV